VSIVVSATTVLAGVVGNPVKHSLSPIIHNAWLAAAGINAVYVAFAPTPDRFDVFIDGLRGGVARGVNITGPFKQRALALADAAQERARRAGAANLLVFEANGSIVADSTDGMGLLAAFASQAPGFHAASGPVVIFGGGGAARSAVAAFIAAGAPEIRLINRSRPHAEAIGAAFGGSVKVLDSDRASAAMDRASAIVNATNLGLDGGEGPISDFSAAPDAAVAMDMIYRPLRTRFLEHARRRGLVTVDGLAMLIGQAAPSFERLFGRAPPAVDVRTIALAQPDAPP